MKTQKGLLALFLAGICAHATAGDKLKVDATCRLSPAADVNLVKGVAVDFTSTHAALQFGSLEARGVFDNSSNKELQYFGTMDFSSSAAPNTKLVISYGNFTVVSKTQNAHKIPCVLKGAEVNLQNVQECPAYFYDIQYTLPVAVLLTGPDGKVLKSYLNEETRTSTFGYDKSGLTGYLKTEELQAAWNEEAISNLHLNSIRESMNDLAGEVQQWLYTTAISETVMIYCPEGGDHDYSTLRAAQQKAGEAYKMSNQGISFLSDLQAVIDVWEAEVKTKDFLDKTARINAQAALDLHLNLAHAYIYMNRFVESQKNILLAKQALSKMVNQSRSGDIVEMEIRLKNRRRNDTIVEANKSAWQASSLGVRSFLATSRQAGNNNTLFLSNLNSFEKSKSLCLPAEHNSDEADAMNDLANGSSGENPYVSQVVKITGQGNALYLSYSKFEKFPVEVCEISELNSLQMVNCGLTALPAEIGELTNLEILNLSKNQISKLPEEIFSMKSLKKITLKGNLISADEIARLRLSLPGCVIK